MVGCRVPGAAHGGSTDRTPAAAFGTIEGGGQDRAHERITRAALACDSEVGAEENCFQPRSMDQLAGHDPYFGGVGAPDSDEISDPSAHCDNADFLAGTVPASYPRTRGQATAALQDCVDHVRLRFDEGVDGAAELVDEQRRLIQAEVVFDPPECQPFAGLEDRAKCVALDGFGRALHGAQDFYSHAVIPRHAPRMPAAQDNVTIGSPTGEAVRKVTTGALGRDAEPRGGAFL